MGHYASDMGVSSPKLATWYDFKRNEHGGHADPVERVLPYSSAGKNLVSHDPCGQVFNFDIWSEKDTRLAYFHDRQCPKPVFTEVPASL